MHMGHRWPRVSLRTSGLWHPLQVATIALVAWPLLTNLILSISDSGIAFHWKERNILVCSTVQYGRNGGADQETCEKATLSHVFRQLQCLVMSTPKTHMNLAADLLAAA